MTLKLFAATACALAFGLAAQAADAPMSTKAELKNATGGSVGTVTLTQGPKGVLMRVEVKGLTPGWHGLHFHEVGDCSKSDFTSAGGHVHTAASMVHGLLNPDANESGDLPNLYVGADGTGAADVFTGMVSLKGTGPAPALIDTNGSAVVIHANPDDYLAQPIGGAGPRVACAVIK